MNNTHNKKLTPLSRILRKNMTKEERHLWYDFLKNLPITIHRQKVMGCYILDFYCADKKFAIELDGSQHYEKQGVDHDMARDAYLREQGITVLRYSNLELSQQFEDVCNDILKHLDL